MGKRKEKPPEKPCDVRRWHRAKSFQMAQRGHWMGTCAQCGATVWIESFHVPEHYVWPFEANAKEESAVEVVLES